LTQLILLLTAQRAIMMGLRPELQSSGLDKLKIVAKILAVTTWKCSWLYSKICPNLLSKD